MHKRFLLNLVVAISIALIGLFITSQATAQSPFSWITSSISLKKGPDTTSVPASLNGNIDCQNESSTICSVPTIYGAATSNNSVRLNGSSNYQPVISYIDNRQHFIPVPHSGTFISYTTEPSYGFYLYFNYNFTSSINITTVSGSSTQYQVNRAQDGKLVDKTNHRLAADYGSMSFSVNGQWMVVSMPNVAMLRVNLQTFEVVPFAGGYNYTIGIDPAIKTAISNDGRYAAVSSNGFNTFKVYDLSTCAAVPDTITGPVSCQSRDLQGFIGQQISGYSFSSSVRFINDNVLSIYATYFVGSARKTAKVIIGSSDSIASQLDLLGMGDSYISGEGAFDYQSGTDTSDNRCHLSLISYPYLIGHELNYNSYHSVACSGAVTDDMTNSTSGYAGQAQNRTIRRDRRPQDEIDSIFASFKPGYINQSDFVSAYQPKTILLSIGGNDMGFSSIITHCAVPWELATCYSTYEDRLELVREINNKVFPKLVQTYQTTKNAGAPDSQIYAIGYPQIAKPNGDCALNVHLREQEIVLSQQLISYLNSVIKLAAAKAGVTYVDTENALNGHRLCEAKLGSVAINGLTLGDDLPFSFGPFGTESYHPNDLGHQLLENKILSATHNLTDPIPTANLNITPPSENGLDILNVPHSGRTINNIQYDQNISNNIIFAQSPAALTIDGPQHALKPASQYRIELHSTPTNLGSYAADANGNLNTSVLIPAGTPAAIHSLHVYGSNLAGDSIDVYKNVYVAASATDYDGDGIPNTSDQCVFVEPSGQDYDQDGTDDACDGNITEAPALPIPPTVDPSPPSTAPQLPEAPIVITQALQPSVGLPSPTQSSSLVLATESIEATLTQTAVTSQSQNTSRNIITTSSSVPVTIQTPQVTSGQDFFAAYYSSPTTTANNSQNNLPTKTPKVLAATTTRQITMTKTNTFKLKMLIIIVALGTFCLAARKLKKKL